MGMYTALFGRIKLKPSIVKVVVKGHYVDWRNLRNIRGVGKHPDVLEFLSLPRSGSVTLGGSAYFDSRMSNVPEWITMAEECGINGDENIDSWGDINYGWVLDPKVNTVTFFSSIKNYSSEYHHFYNILPLIADDWLLFELYEEDQSIRHPDRIFPYHYHGNVKDKLDYGNCDYLSTSHCVNRQGLKLAAAVKTGKYISV